MLDSDGSPLRGTLVEGWQANAAGRYVDPVDGHAAPLDPNFTGAGRCLTDAEGRYRFVTVKRRAIVVDGPQAQPARAVEARAAYAGAVAQAGLLLGSLAGEHERAAGSWQAEWTAVSEVFRLASGAVVRATESLAGLRVDTARMRTNMALGEGGAGGPGSAPAIVDRVLRSYESRTGREEER